jgi:predicted GNAT family acetyltransferase
MDIFEILKEKYPDIKFALYSKEKDMTVLLTRFMVPFKLRNTGIGTKFMEDLIKIADENGYKIKLSPSNTYGGNVNRLFDFYSRFGFVKNIGDDIDGTHNELMYRKPKKLNEEIERIKIIINQLL